MQTLRKVIEFKLLLKGMLMLLEHLGGPDKLWKCSGTTLNI